MLFPRVSEYTKHYLYVHESKEPEFGCPKCSKTFSKALTLQNHRKKKHNVLHEECPHCQKTFSSSYLWTRHILVHSDKRPYVCSCDKTFKTKTELQSHQKIHLPIELRNFFTCEG